MCHLSPLLVRQPSGSMCTWLLSLVLSLTYALSLACLYLGFTQHHATRQKYMHMLQGIEGSRPPRVVDLMLQVIPPHFPLHRGLINSLLTYRIVASCVLGLERCKIICTWIEELKCPKKQECIYLKPQKMTRN